MSATITKFVAENFMKLSAIDIDINGHDVTIVGKNEVGKSTAINAIWFALTGKNKPDEPIKKGKDKAVLSAKIKRENGEVIICTRTLKRDGKDELKVTTEEGADYKSPQAFLDKILGDISFDVFDFLKKTPALQKKYLQEILGINTDDLDARKAGELKTKKALEDSLTTAQQELLKYVEYPEPLTIREMSEIREIQNTQNEILNTINLKTIEVNSMRSKYNQDTGSLNESVNKFNSSVERINKLQAELKQLIIDTQNLEETNKKIKSQLVKDHDLIVQKEKELSEIEKPDTSILSNLVTEINDHNEKVRLQNERAEKVKSIELIKEKIEESKIKLKELDDERVKMISNVEMPVNGLDFTEDGLLFDGLPFTKEQFSTAKRNMIGFEISIALNPKLKIMKVKDWALLDTETKNQLIDLKNKYGFIIFAEQVTDDKEIGFIIEDIQHIEEKE